MIFLVGLLLAILLVITCRSAWRGSRGAKIAFGVAVLVSGMIALLLAIERIEAVGVYE